MKKNKKSDLKNLKFLIFYVVYIINTSYALNFKKDNTTNYVCKEIYTYFKKKYKNESILDIILNEYKDKNYIEVIGLYKCFIKKLENLPFKYKLILANSYFYVGYYRDAEKIYAKVFIKKNLDISKLSLENKNFFESALNNYISILILKNDLGKIKYLLLKYSKYVKKFDLSTKVTLLKYLLKNKERYYCKYVINNTILKKFSFPYGYIKTSLGYIYDKYYALNYPYISLALNAGIDRLIYRYEFNILGNKYLNSANSTVSVSAKVTSYTLWYYPISFYTVSRIYNGYFYDAIVGLKVKYKKIIKSSLDLDINFYNSTLTNIKLSFGISKNKLLLLSTLGTYFTGKYYFSPKLVYSYEKKFYLKNKSEIMFRFYPYISYLKDIDYSFAQLGTNILIFYKRKKYDLYLKTDMSFTKFSNEKEIYRKLYLEGGLKYAF